MHRVLIYKDDVIKLIEKVIEKHKKSINGEDVVMVKDLNKFINALEQLQ